MDPELQLAMQLSKEEDRRRQEDEAEELAQLEMALEMSRLELGRTPPRQQAWAVGMPPQLADALTTVYGLEPPPYEVDTTNPFWVSELERGLEHGTKTFH